MIAQPWLKPVAIAAWGLFVGGVAAAWASGFSATDPGVKAMGLAGALVARAEDPTAGFYNPGALALVKAFGRQDESAATFKDHNDALYAASFKAQFISGLIQPVMMLIGNINYVLVAVVGGLQVASGSLSLGSVRRTRSASGRRSRAI